MNPQDTLRRLFDAAVAAAQPARVLPAALPKPPRGRTIVIGAGKAAAAMAQALESHWDAPLEGLVVTRYGHGAPCRRIRVAEAAHPIPDANGVQAAREMLNLVAGLTADDLVIGLWSGGGSALLTLPPDGLSLAQLQTLHRQMLHCGAPIGAINTLRRHLSASQGGRLALACAPATLVNLLISDVPGDQLADIASGPGVADPSDAESALRVAADFDLQLPEAARRLLQDPAWETPKPGDARLSHVRSQLVASAQQSLQAAADAARAAGLAPLILGDSLEGEAREVAKVHAAIARQTLRHQQPLAPPCVILSGGETSVTVRGQGRGGRNAEFALALALALQGQPSVHALACDTDGIDGSEDNAGARLGPDSLARMQARGIDAAACLADNDAYRAFAAVDDLIVTGPTRTNVNDFRALLISA